MVARVPQPLDLLVDRGVLLDVGVGLRDVRLGLVVVVVGDEVLDRVVGQQLAELVGQLGGQRLVRRHHQRRPLQPLDQPGRRRALAGAGRAEQHDVLLARADAPLEVVDRGRLVAGRLVVADDLERGEPRSDVGDGSHDAHRTSTVRQAADHALPVRVRWVRTSIRSGRTMRSRRRERGPDPRCLRVRVVVDAVVRRGRERRA